MKQCHPPQAHLPVPVHVPVNRIPYDRRLGSAVRLPRHPLPAMLEHADASQRGLLATREPRWRVLLASANRAIPDPDEFQTA